MNETSQPILDAIVDTFEHARVLGTRGYTWVERFVYRVTQSRLFRFAAGMGLWRFMLVLAFLVTLAAPLLSLVPTALIQYHELRGWADDAVHQLTSIKTLIPQSPSPSTTKGSPGTSGTGGTNGKIDQVKAILTPEVLTKVNQHCNAALLDFERIDRAIDQREGVIRLALVTPFAPKILAIQKLAEIGIDGAALGSELATVGMDFTQTFATSPFSSDGGALLTNKSFADLQQALLDTDSVLSVINTKLHTINLGDIPFSKAQLAQVKSLEPQLPKYLTDIETFLPYVPLAGWALGVGSPRNYFIQTMDRSELRPGGGFNGSWGVLSIDGGRIGKISLTDVTFVDYNIHNKAAGQPAPEAYRKWWPFYNWGLRDANLSGDFPTSAQLSVGTYQREEGVNNIDGGVIDFSPLVIEHLLAPDVLGPLTIPCYNTTVTSTNLEDILHYYQLDQAGLAAQDRCSGSNTSTSLRKRFTAALASALQDQARAAIGNLPTLQAIIKSVRQDMSTKDLEIWINNPQIESLLTKDHRDAAISRDSSLDSTYIVNANIGVNKGSVYAKTKATEVVTLDNQGGAFHQLLIQVNYQPTGNVYGQLTYRDFIRVYTSPDARLQGGEGFDQQFSPPLCYLAKPDPTGKLPDPIAPDPKLYPGASGVLVPYANVSAPCYPDQAAACPNNVWNPGYDEASFPLTGGSDAAHIDQVAGPTITTSDEPGRAMFGGLSIIPAFCKGYVSLSWYVPNVQHANQPYTFMAQRQSGFVTEYLLKVYGANGKTLINVDKPELNQDCTWNTNGQTTCP